MNERGKWQGMLSIVRFNWPFYMAAMSLLITGMGAMFARGTVAAVGGLVVFGCLYFLLGSLGVTHWIYDCSDLYQWSWLNRALGDAQVKKMVFCHSGFDEASEMMKRRFPRAEWQVLDHYDQRTMTEASILRARKLFPPTIGTIAAPYDHWPLQEASVDVVFGLLAIHELRSVAERRAWILEANRCLKVDGSVVLVEHVRDLANFAAFGPGFFHFHSMTAWRRSWEPSALNLSDSFRITPFVRVFVLKRL